MNVRVSLLYFEGCPNWTVTDGRLREALTRVGHGDADVEYRRVSTPEEAEAAQFRGSPTVLVNGRDPFLDHERPVGLSCRVYRTPDGLSGSPTVEQLVEALQ
ncbi:DF family (seleno)protein [Candidatus Blastococcus massiliensis]|uniref:DF family (seleno)protein n=1 Tax=Candidatus Blastococcus massiliensis TaxID=1470358 RepID=UPI003C7DEDB6